MNDDQLNSDTENNRSDELSSAPPGDFDAAPEEAGAMTLLDHLEDLRWTLFKSVVAFACGCVVVGIFLVTFADLLRWPYEFATRGYEDVTIDGLINTSFLGVFSVIFQLMLIGGLALALPIILYYFSAFISPGLTPSEKGLLRPGCLGALGLFLIGALFSFFVLVPAGLRASVVFNDMLGFRLLVTASSYYALLTFAVLGVGFAFELPLILMLCVYLNFVSTDQLRRFRRYSIVLFLCLAAVVTPTPDPVTFLFLAVPMSLLYETAIYFGGRIERWKARQEADAEWT